MAEGGGAPPAEAVRGVKGVSSLIAIVVAVVTFLAGLGVGALFLAPAPAPELPRLLLGTNTPFPPFEYYNTTTNALEGFDIELIQTLVTRAGYSYEWRDFRDFSALLYAVAAEGVDVAIGAITMNGPVGEERNKTLKFTDPYYEADQGVLKRASDTTNYCAATDCTVEELNKTNLKVGVQAITTSEYWAADQLKNVELTTYPDVAQVLQALQAGTVDIVIIDLPAAQGISAANPAFAVEGTIQTDELYAFATAKDDPKALIPKLNSALASVKADGTYQRLLDKYF